MKHFSKYSNSTLHEATKIQVSNTKHLKISLRIYYKNKKPLEIQYEILNEENTNLQDNHWPFNG